MYSFYIQRRYIILYLKYFSVVMPFVENRWE